MSNYDSYRGVFGHECINELIVSRIMDILGIPHVEYRIIYARVMIDGKELETWISVSDNFCRNNEEKLAYDMFYDLQKRNKESLCVDYLIANRDRHGSNLEVLRSIEDESIRLAPLFDQGVSLLFSTYGDEEALDKTDVMQDFLANNYIGSRSLEYNLSLIPDNADLRINVLKQEDKKYILEGIERILTQKHIEKIWEMVWKRWCHFEEICSEEKRPE